MISYSFCTSNISLKFSCQKCLTSLNQLQNDNSLKTQPEFTCNAHSEKREP